ncbi:MAG: hypothetical protein LAP21_11150 [Acidobacteriia bacterium]|nr:hypothetical protein [Terriglobia bacterium]
MRELFIQWLVPFIGSGLQIFVLTVMVRKNLRKSFPVFFSYSIFYAVSPVIGFMICGFAPDHFDNSVWVASAITAALTFGVLYEVFKTVMKPYSAVIDLGRLLFGWAAAFLLLVACVTGAATVGSQHDKVTAGLQLVDRTILLIECGLLMLLVFLEKRMGLSWRSHGMAIALGLGISAAVDLCVSFFKMHSTVATFAQMQFVNNVVYMGVVGFWAIALWLPEAKRRTVLDSPSRLVFQRWNEVLMSTPISAQASQLAMADVDSFIPGVEKTVERIMARKMSVN